MKRFVLGGIAAAMLGLGLMPQTASAYWATKVRYRWDPICGRYVAHSHRVWIPDCPPPPPPPPVVCRPSHRHTVEIVAPVPPPVIIRP